MSLPSEKVFLAIKKNFVVTHVEWKIYDQLFGTKERIALLNSRASQVFASMQNSILDNCALALARLTDRSSIGRFENLSIPKLIELVADEDAELASAMQDVYDKLEEKVEKFRRHRHKRIAHLDLDTATKEADLEPYIFGDIAASLALIEELLNIYEYAHRGSRTIYSAVILPLGSDGEALIRALKEADAYKVAEVGGLVEVGMWKEGDHKDA